MSDELSPSSGSASVLFGRRRAGNVARLCHKEGGRLALLAKDIGADSWPGDEAPTKGKTSRPRTKDTEEARALWEGASPAPASHLYLKARGITSLDLRVDADGWLLVPGYRR